MSVKKYLLGRAESALAWIGWIGFILEILLHLGAVSTLMLLLYAALVVTPEDRVKELFRAWTQKIRDFDQP